MPQPIFESERLLFRPLEPTDEPFLFAIRSDAQVAQFLNRPLVKKRSEARAFLQQRMADGAENRSFYWAMVLKKGRPKTIGTICLWNIFFDQKQAEIGYELLPKFWRKGLTSEAVLRVLEVSFSSLGFEKIEARTHETNTPSRLLLEKLGFQKIGEDVELLIFLLEKGVAFEP